MTQKGFNSAAVTIFGLAGLLHLIRSILGWELVLNDWVIPVWVSITAVVVLFSMAFKGSKLAKK